MKKNDSVIEAAHRFGQQPKRSPPKLLNGDEVATAMIQLASDRCLEYGATVDLVVAALIKQVAKLADENKWSEDRKRDMLPPAWVRMIKEKNGDIDPY